MGSVPLLQLTHCIILQKSFIPSVPWFPYLSNAGMNARTDITWFFKRVNELLWVTWSIQWVMWWELCFIVRGPLIERTCNAWISLLKWNRWVVPLLLLIMWNAEINITQLCPGREPAGKADMNTALYDWWSARGWTFPGGSCREVAWRPKPACKTHNPCGLCSSKTEMWMAYSMPCESELHGVRLASWDSTSLSLHLLIVK